jgi:hypothetical protein
MINFAQFQTQIDNLKKQFSEAQTIPEQIRSITNKVQDSESRELLNDLSVEFEKAMKDAEQGKLRDFTQFINRAQNIANGNESKSN